MAASEQVKQYLAYWFQLGKRLVLDNGRSVLPEPVFEEDHYSSAFEACWQQALAVKGNCYLEGTIQTIGELLSEQWDITGCARCEMPVPTMQLGVQSAPCPCADLPTWPNTELPQPRSPVSSRSQLEQIRDRLSQEQKS